MQNHTNAHQEAIDDAIFDAVKGSGKVNIIVAGKTGVGKSTLINCVFRGDLAKTGSGRPVTQGIEEITKEGHPITIIDSKGLELKDYKKITDSLKDFLQERSHSHEEDSHVHAAWVCIQEGGSRVEEAEIELCQMLQEMQIPVIAVITKSMGSNNEFSSQVKKLLPMVKHVVNVRAQATEILEDDGEVISLKVKGINDLISCTAELIPEAKKRAFANAVSSRHQASMKLKKEQAEKEVLAASALAAAAGATPIPFSDTFLLVPIQIGMLAKIGITYGMEVSTSALTTLVMAALGSSAASLAGRAIVTGALKMVPGFGSAAGGAIAATTAAALTKLLGNAYIAVLSEFCDKNPGQDLNVRFIADELKRRMKLGSAEAA